MPHIHQRIDDGKDVHGTLHAARHRLVAVVHIVRGRGHHDAGAVLGTIPGSSRATALGGPSQVVGQRDVERRVEEHGHEVGPPRRLLELGPAPFPLVREAQAGEHTDDPPPAIEQVQERPGQPSASSSGWGATWTTVGDIVSAD